jgi:Zn finger protein HypA/HybF involved in hydrogenase expression
MGKRSWQLKCLNCTSHFWEWFEHLTRDELISWLKNTECDHCSSTNWEFTTNTRFAGSSVQTEEFIKIRCQSEFKFKDSIQIGGKHRHSVLNVVTLTVCPSCEKQDWEIGDEPGNVNSIPS